MNNKKNIGTMGWDYSVAFLQYLIPHHMLSMLIHTLTRSESRWFKNILINFTIKIYKINIADVKTFDIRDYSSFNAFFTRQLRANVRDIDNGDDIIISPVDGAISQIGKIEFGQIVQAKGRHYTVWELLAGDQLLSQKFKNCQFVTIYLAPRDYHRIHMPLTGTLRSMSYVPGKLFSVSPRAVRIVPNIFARNERVITVFETKFGLVLLVLVGAIFVGSMETVWQGKITPSYGDKVKHWIYHDEREITINKGEEIGRFNMGSTVVVLMEEGYPKQFAGEFKVGSIVYMGQAMT